MCKDLPEIMSTVSYSQYFESNEEEKDELVKENVQDEKQENQEEIINLLDDEIPTKEYK